MAAMCPRLTPERRAELQEKLGLSGGSLWWPNPADRNEAKEYAAGQQWASRPADPAATCTPDASARFGQPYHGAAEFVGIIRPIYFDLGGIYNLADAGAYVNVCAAAALSTEAATLVSPKELGFTSARVPIDMAGVSGGGSSVV